MGRKFFFFDYDGTLAIPRTRTIPDSALRTLDELRAAGHVVSLATGRLQANALDYISYTGIDNLVADGGNSVTVNGECTWIEPLSIQPIRECLHKLDELGIPWAVNVENELVRYTPYPEFEAISGDYYLETCVDESLSIDSLNAVFKIYIPCSVEDEPAFLATGALDGVPHVRYNPTSIFVEPMDKPRGIKRMVDELGGSYSDVVVFGDGLNDITMFEEPWLKIAMGNGRDIIKQKADYVAPPCDEDGIYEACRHFGWVA